MGGKKIDIQSILRCSPCVTETGIGNFPNIPCEILYGCEFFFRARKMLAHRLMLQTIILRFEWWIAAQTNLSNFDQSSRWCLKGNIINDDDAHAPCSYFLKIESIHLITFFTYISNEIISTILTNFGVKDDQ